MAEAANEVLDSHLDFLLRELNGEDSSDDGVPCSQISTCTNNDDEASMVLCSQQNKNYPLTQSKFFNNLSNQENKNGFTPLSSSCSSCSHEEKSANSTYLEDLPVSDVLDSALCNPTMACNNTGDLIQHSVENDSDKHLSFKRKKTETCSQPVLCSSTAEDKDDFCMISSWPGRRKLHNLNEDRKNSNCVRTGVVLKENRQCSNVSNMVLAKTQQKITLFPVDIKEDHDKCNTLPSLHNLERQVDRSENEEAKSCAESKSYEFDLSSMSKGTEHYSHLTVVEEKSSAATPSPHDAEEEIDTNNESHIKNQADELKLMSEAGANIFDTPEELFKMKKTYNSPYKLQNFHNKQKIFPLELELIGVQGQPELLNCQAHLELPTICERAKLLTSSEITEIQNQLETPKVLNFQKEKKLFNLHEKTNTSTEIEPTQSNYQKLLKSPVLEEQLELASVDSSKISKTHEGSSITLQVSKPQKTEKDLTLLEINMQQKYDVEPPTSQMQPDYPSDQEYLELEEKSEGLNTEQPTLKAHFNSSKGQELSDKQVQEKSFSLNVQNVEKQEDLQVTQKLPEPTFSEHQPQFLSFEDHIEPINVPKELETTSNKKQNVQLQFCQWQFKPLNNLNEQETVRNDLDRGVEVSIKDEQTNPITVDEQMKEFNSKKGNFFHDGLDQSNIKTVMETMTVPKVEANTMRSQNCNISINEAKEQEMPQNYQNYKELSTSNIPKNKMAEEGCQHVIVLQNPQETAQKAVSNITFRKTSSEVHGTLGSENKCEKFSNLQEVPFDFSYETNEAKLILSDQFAEVAMIENVQDAQFSRENDYQPVQFNHDQCKDIIPDNLPVSISAPLLLKNNFTSKPDEHAFQEVPISSGIRDKQTDREESQQSQYSCMQSKKSLQELCSVDVEIYVHSRETCFTSLMHQSQIKNIAEKTMHNLPSPALKYSSTDQKIDANNSLNCPNIKQLQNLMKRGHFDQHAIETQDKNFIPNHLLSQIQIVKNSPNISLSRKKCQNQDNLKTEEESFTSFENDPNYKTVCNQNMLPVKNDDPNYKIVYNENMLSVKNEIQVFGIEGKGATNSTISPLNKTIEKDEGTTLFNNGKQTIQGLDHIVPEKHLYADDEWKEVSLYGDALGGMSKF